MFNSSEGKKDKNTLASDQFIYYDTTCTNLNFCQLYQFGVQNYFFPVFNYRKITWLRMGNYHYINFETY